MNWARARDGHWRFWLVGSCTVIAAIVLASVSVTQKSGGDPWIVDTGAPTRQLQATETQLTPTHSVHLPSFIVHASFKGLCMNAVIPPLLFSSSIPAAADMCLANPNCTFFMVSSSGLGVLCSGRQASLTPVEENEWTSADRRGCEHYTVELSQLHSAEGLLPNCFPNGAACAYVNKATHTCLSSVLPVSTGGFVSNGLQEYLCYHTSVGLRMLRRPTREDHCAWLARGLSSAAVMTSLDTKMDLSPDMLVFDFKQHTLVEHRKCLCDNWEHGLVIGPWCGGWDCKWYPDQRGALP
jgi:hypothetical protein